MVYVLLIVIACLIMRNIQLSFAMRRRGRTEWKEVMEGGAWSLNYRDHYLLVRFCRIADLGDVGGVEWNVWKSRADLIEGHEPLASSQLCDTSGAVHLAKTEARNAVDLHYQPGWGGSYDL